MKGQLRAFFSRLRATSGPLLTWWLRELRDIWEELLLRVAPRWATRAVVHLHAHGGSLWLMQGREHELIMTFSTDSRGMWPASLPEEASRLRGARTVLALDPEFVFVRSLLLPESVERNLEDVVTFQLERESPIPPDRACIDKWLAERLRAQRQIRVEVLISHRNQIEQVSQLVSNWGLQVVRIGAGKHPAALTGNFLHRRARLTGPQLTSLERRLALSAATLTTVWLGVIGTHWCYERVQVVHELERLADSAAGASRLMHDLKVQAVPGEQLVSLMGQPDAVDTLSSLTTEIPKDSWAYELEISAQWPQQPRIKLSGFAPVATLLIGRLESSGRFQSVRLVSAVSAGLGTGQDRLQLTAQLAIRPARPGALQ